MVSFTTSQCLDLARSSTFKIRSITSQLLAPEETAQNAQQQRKESHIHPAELQQIEFFEGLTIQLEVIQKWLDGLADLQTRSLPRSMLLYLLDILEQLCVPRTFEKHHDGHIHGYNRLKGVAVADDTLLMKIANNNGPLAQERREDLLRRLAAMPLSASERVTNRLEYEAHNDGRTIAALAADCLNLLENESKVASGHEFEEFRTQLIRFNLWTSNIGVFAKSGLSLDNRLEAAPDIAELFKELLDLLQFSIGQASSSSGPKKIDAPHEAVMPAVIDQILKPMEDETDTYVPSKQLQEIAGLITRLHRLSIAIRAAGDRNPYSRIINFRIVDENGEDIDSAFESFIQGVLEFRYRNLPSSLRQRLASAICFRRRRFLYQEARSQSLAQRSSFDPRLEGHHPNEAGLFLNLASPPSATGSRTSQMDTPPARLSTDNLTLGSPSTVHSGLDRNKLRLPAIGLQTQASIAPSENSVVQRSTEIPDAPTVPKGMTEYQCPYCQKVLAARTFSGTRWKAHFEKDLEPYNCLFDGCAEPNALFASSKDWLSHTTTHYSEEWTCRVCRKEAYRSKQELQRHLMEVHTQLAGSQIQTLLQHGVQPREPPAVLFPECLFCQQNPNLGSKADDQNPQGTSTMNDHIANHLLSLSMIALPLAWQEKNKSSGAYWSLQVSETGDSIPVSSDGNSSSGEPIQRLPLPENEVEEKQIAGAWMDAQELAEPEDISADLSKPNFTIISPGSDDRYLTIEDKPVPKTLSSLSTLQQSSSFAASATILEEASPYRYSPLEMPSQSFRLLRIMPAQHITDHISAYMSHCFINDGPEYSALCYCWDYSDHDEHVILVDGRALMVRKNLLEALSVIRDQYHEVRVWVDALCINMDDIEERSAQIANMKDIFRNASNVWIWLGGEDGTSAALSQLRRSSERILNKPPSEDGLRAEGSTSASGSPPFRRILNRREQFDIRVEEHREKEPSQNTDLTPLLRNRVFSRRWVIQELVVARSATVFSRASAIAWPDFEATIEQLIRFDSRIQQTEAWQIIQVIRSAQGRADSGLVEQPASFETIVTLAVHFRNQDPRDTIYALLSLIREDELPWAAGIDYTMPFTEVAVDFVLYTISSSKSLNIICRPWIEEWGNPLPSWIRTVNERGSQVTSIQKIADSFIGMPGKCKYKATQETEPEVRVIYHDSLLGARGFWFTTISEVRLPDLESPARHISAGSISLNEYLRQEMQEKYPTVAGAFDELGSFIESVLNADEIVRIITGRLFIRTDENEDGNRAYFGLAPPESRVGDYVCLLLGCDVPVILRPSRTGYKLIGEAYVAGIMHGEEMDKIAIGGRNSSIMEFKIE